MSYVDSNPFASQHLSGINGGTAAAKRIENQISGIGSNIDYLL